MLIADECDGGVDGLKKSFGVDAGEDEAAFVEGFGAFGAGANANGWERVADGGEERGFFRKSSGVTDHRKCVHLKAVVVVEAERLMLDDSAVKLEAR
jgi:hypothetical protein